MKLTTVCGREFIIDDEDFSRFDGMSFQMRGRYVAAYKPKGDTEQEREYLHRVLMDAKDEEEVDHKDGDPFNNCKDNLRIATRSEQLYNQPSRTVYPRGVIRIASSGRYHARIVVKGEAVNLGYYEKLEDAVSARLNYEKEHGIFVRRNT